jgi:uncharacterized RDD family membrane protein YckC
METRPNVTVIDNYSLASPTERMLAFTVDYLIAFGFLFIPYVGPALSFLYLLCRDGIKFLNYKSIGKKIFKIKVIKGNELHASLWQSIKRNLIFLPNCLLMLPGNYKYAVLIINIITMLIEVYLLFTSSDTQRMGDSIADTLVIEED